MSNVPVAVIRDALTWSSGLAVDADGAPRAYHPEDKGLDRLMNAGQEGVWWGLACDADGLPCVQGPSDPAPGYYVSCTALVDRTLPRHDPRRYVDAATVPYVVVPRSLIYDGVHSGANRYRVQLGDLALVRYRDKASAAIVADIGPTDSLGEGSIALAARLGIPSSPRTGGVQRDVHYVVFLRSARGWPRTLAEIEEESARLYVAWTARCS